MTCDYCERDTGDEIVVNCGVCGAIVCCNCVSDDYDDLCLDCGEEQENGE
jgi:hypothetical protein